MHGVELDLFSKVEPILLLCCPVAKFKGKAGLWSSDWVLQLVEEFSHYVGLLCGCSEGKLSALFGVIIVSFAEHGADSGSIVGKKGMRELNNLFCSINYDVHSSSISRDRNKARAQRDYL
jgi:hypothetical protein